MPVDSVASLAELALHRNRHLADRRWDCINCSLVRPADRFVFTLALSAHTTEYFDRWYLATMDSQAWSVDLTPGVQLALMETLMVSALEHLNTYLDHRCTCLPAKNGTLGPSCPWHAAGMPKDWKMEHA